MAIPEQFIDELVARSEISDVVSSYVSLKKKGANRRTCLLYTFPCLRRSRSTTALAAERGAG